MSIHTAGFVCVWNPSGSSWDDITEYVMSVEGEFQTTGSNNGIAFGDSSEASATVKLDPNANDATGTPLPPLDVSVWPYVPVRIEFNVDVQVAMGAAGVIIDFDQDTDTIKFGITGYKQLISRVRVYSPLFQWRPIATKTTALSIEDPTDPDYVAGPLNWLLWQAGGRPLEQAASYPAAAFYYSLSQAPIAPKFSWIAGEDGWQQALQLVRATGGQLYQRPDGVIAYVSPLSIAGGLALFSLTKDDWNKNNGITRKGSALDLVASYTTTYVPRILVGVQEVVSDSEARVVAQGATITIELEPQYPILESSLETASMAGTQLLPEAISATFFDGTQVAQGTGYTHTLDVRAQLVTIVITNVGSIPFAIEKITLRARPIVPGEAGTVTLGSGTPTLSIEQNPNIQSRGHALRLTRMLLAFYATARPIISVKGVLYDPENHQVGNAGTLTHAQWGLSNAPVVLLGVKHSKTGVEADLDVMETTGLPKLSDYFLIQTASQAGLTRKIGY